MLGYFVRRLLLAAVTIWAITVVTFVIIQLPPGDFVDAYVAQSAAMGSAITHGGGGGAAAGLRPRRAAAGPVRASGWA